MRTRRPCVLLFAAVLTVTGCSSSGHTSGSATSVPAITAPASFTAAGSIRAAYTLNAHPHDQLVLTGANNAEVARATADDLGSAIFYDVAPGDGYTVRHVNGS